MYFQFCTAILILVTGCSDSAQLLQLQQEIEDLRAENQELRVGQEAIKTSLETLEQLKGLTTEFETLRKDWGSFEKGFEASLRDELQKNIESAVAALQSISNSNESSSAVVKEIEGLATAWRPRPRNSKPFVLNTCPKQGNRVLLETYRSL